MHSGTVIVCRQHCGPIVTIASRTPRAASTGRVAGERAAEAVLLRLTSSRSIETIPGPPIRSRTAAARDRNLAPRAPPAYSARDPGVGAGLKWGASDRDG